MIMILEIHSIFATSNAPRMPAHHENHWLRFVTILAAFVLVFVSDAVAQSDAQSLFDGKTLNGWTTLDGKPVRAGWEVVDGMIHLKPSAKPAGHIVTEREYGDLDLSFEWKIAQGGNSGLKYRVRQYNGKTLGCEYQIIDDSKYRKGVEPRTSAGALYGLFEPNRQKHLNPSGEFNSARIVIRGNLVDHWLNNRLIVSITIGSDEWKSRVAQSKFSEFKEFALNRRGKIMLTDHGSEVWYRNFEFHPVQESVHSSRERVDTSKAPGVVIAHYPKSTGKYVGSPGIAIVGSGVYLAKHDEFGPGSTEHSSAITQLFRSENAGTTWRHTHTFDGLFWASIFTLDDAVYLLGTDKHHGNVVIFRSLDVGKSWTKPTDAEHGVLRGGENHTAPVPVVIHNGRVWRAMEDAGSGTVWGQRYRAMMMSAPVNANLLKASSWTFSKPIARKSEWLGGKFNAWLEGNAVVAPDNKIVNVLRVDYKPEGGVAAILHVSDDGRSAQFSPDQDIIDFPGGATKFTIRHDGRTNLYWTLSNFTPEFHRDTPAPSTRNTLALASSPDLRNWTVQSVVLYHADAKHHGFQYVDWLFEGSDMIAASRTAYDDGLGGAHQFHDANYLTFHRIRNFHLLKMADSTPEYLNRLRGHN